MQHYLSNYKKGAASDKVYQLLAHGRWFSPGNPASSTPKAGRYDIVEILLKVALNTIKIKSNQNRSITKYILCFPANCRCLLSSFMCFLMYSLIKV